MTPNEVVFLFDVDNTLLDNDRVAADLKRCLEREVGRDRAERYRAIFEQLRTELGYADYLGALQRYGNLHPRDPHLLSVSRFMVNYPFANRLFPNSPDVIEHTKKRGPAVILSDGDVVLGPNGAGHFVKMVHDGIEYGLMESYAEGFALLKRKPVFKFDIRRIAEIWRHGSVVRSRLLDLTARALGEDSELTGIAPYIADSGQGRWTVEEALDLNTSAPVIILSLLERLRSRDTESYADELLAAMRNQLGGHAIKREASNA